MTDKVITEVTPLGEKDCFLMVDRDKDSFTYPLHKHEEMELNFVEHCDGARRIVGDSIEVLGKYDLVLVGSGLEHMWDQYDCQSHSIHEITIQFPPDLLGEQFFRQSWNFTARLPPSHRLNLASTGCCRCSRSSTSSHFRITIICWPASRLPT